MAVKTVVEICNFNDTKLRDALAGLSSQTFQPDTVLIADGGSGEGYRREIMAFIEGEPAVSNMNIIWKTLEGTQPETRQKSIPFLEGEITAFLDSDEVPPPAWLEALTAPIREGRADFTGGPMLSNPGTDYISSYYTELEKRIYGSDVEIDVTYMPLGNTAWKTEILRKLGFDPRLAQSYGQAEDYDLEMRSVDAGYRGLFVREAEVRHNQTYPAGFTGLARKRYAYLLAAAVVMTKNRRLRKRASEKRERVKHPFAKYEALMKPVALIHGFLRWHLVVSRRKI